MKLTISQPELAEALTTAKCAVSAKPTHPILGTLLLTCNSKTNRLNITAFDLSFGIHTQCDCNVENEGTVALPAKLLTEVVSSLPPNEITLNVENELAIITHSNGECRILGMDSQEYPELPEPIGTTIKIPAAKLRSAIESTLFAASREETKQVLAGVHFKFSPTTWEAAATDGHRLAVASGTIDSAEDIASEAAINVPYQALIELEKILSNVSETSDCTINIDNGIAVFNLPNIRVISRLIEGEYPKYSSLMPQYFQHEFTTGRKAFDGALKRVGIIADKKDKIVKIEFDNTNLQATISTESQDVGSATESVVIKSENSSQNFEIGFNIKYLNDALKFISTDEVMIKANKPTSPVIINPVGGILNQLILVMPVQIISTQSKESTQETTEVSTEESENTIATNETIATESDSNTYLDNSSNIEPEVPVITKTGADVTTKTKGRKKKLQVA